MLEQTFIYGFAALATAIIISFLSIKTKEFGRNISLYIALAASALLAIGSAIVIVAKQKISIQLLSLHTLNFAFSIDRLSAFFILIISVVSFCVGIYTRSYVKHYSGIVSQNMLVGLMEIFVLSMLLTVASGNMIIFLFFWEIMSITSLFLVFFEKDSNGTRKAGLFYFAMTQLSTLFLMISFILIHETAGTWNISEISTLGSNPALILILLFIGFGIKAGIVPFHKWLPYAHPASPSNISALMSGVMLKVAIYGFVRFLLLEPSILSVGIIVLLAGTMTAILGIIYALKETDIKRMLAYSSIENVGIIFIGLGLFIIFGHYGLSEFALIVLLAALFHAFNHAIFKSLLFLTAGSVAYSAETKEIEKLGGLNKAMPYTAAIFLIGALSIAALPPFNGFLSEVLIFQAFLASSIIPSPVVQVLLIVCLSVFALTSAFAAFTFIKLYNGIFLGLPRSEHAKSAKEVHGSMIIAPAILAVICALLGIFAPIIAKALGYNIPMPNMLLIAGVIAAAAAIVVLGMHLASSKKKRTSETWGCGINSQTSKMQYSSAGFSEPMVSMFRPIYRSRKDIELEYADNHKTVLAGGHANMTMIKVFEEYIYNPIIKSINFIAERFDRLQNNNLDTYVIYAFIAVLSILIYMRWFI